VRPGAPAPALWRRDDVAVALGLALLALVLAAGNWLWRTDRLVYDFGLALWSRPVPDDVVIVAIDEASIDAIGRWPWKRSVHATLLERLAAAQPRAIGLDIVFSEEDPDPQQDRVLADALRKAAPVVMPVTGLPVPGEGIRVLEPVPLLRGAVRLGVSEPLVDDDGVLRRAFAEAGPPGRLFPHMATVLLQAGGQDVHPGLAYDRIDDLPQLPGWLRKGLFLIRYAAAPGAMRHVSYVDVLTGTVPVEQLRGRYLLVGMTAYGLGDTLATPVNASQRAMPGVEVLAHTLDTLRQGSAVRVLPPLQAGVVSGLAVALLVVAFGLAGTRVALALALLSLPLALACSLLALRAGLWWSPAPFMLAAAVAYPLWSWRRLERGVAVLDREIARLGAQPGLLPPAAADMGAPVRDHLAARLASLHTAAETLRLARSFLADVLAGLPTAMLVDDGAGRVLLANPPAARLFEVETAAEMQGLDLARLLAEFDCEPTTDWPQELARVRRTQDELVVQAHMAGHGDHLLQARGVPMHGGVRLIVAMADVGPLKRAEREREEVLAFVSHDLRSPATSIALLAELQLAGRGTLGTDELLREVQRLARRTLALADDFVRVAQAAQRPLQLEAVDTAVLMAEAVADFEPQAAAQGVLLRTQADAALPPVPMDRALVLRALGNLLSNAIKHSPRGATVRLQALRADGPGCVFEVADRGPGMDAQARQRLASHEGLLPTAAGGVGFGLLFVQRVARRHGGRLGARPGEGGRGSVLELHIGSASGNP
jgi:CHASE2 domain-containing sensor protein/signal transduction histidine kinase